jgi:hypothetical protein
MKLVEDATKLVINCEFIEDAIFNIVSSRPSHDTIETFQDLIKHVPERINECHEMRRELNDKNANILCYDLHRMAQRLDAAILYAKNRFKLD